MCSGWCNNWVTRQHARCNNESKKKNCSVTPNKIKFEILVHLVGFTIEITLRCTALWTSNSHSSRSLNLASQSAYKCWVCQDIAADSRTIFSGSTRQHKPFKYWLRLRLKRNKNPACSRTPLIRINWEGEPTGHAENPDNWIFLKKNTLHSQFEVGKKNL